MLCDFNHSGSTSIVEAPCGALNGGGITFAPPGKGGGTFGADFAASPEATGGCTEVEDFAWLSKAGFGTESLERRALDSKPPDDFRCEAGDGFEPDDELTSSISPNQEGSTSIVELPTGEPAFGSAGVSDFPGFDGGLRLVAIETPTEYVANEKA